jgi:hypothetical protein
MKACGDKKQKDGKKEARDSGKQKEGKMLTKQKDEREANCEEKDALAS